MEYLKSKDQVLAEKIGSVHESVTKMGDVWQVKALIDIPKSLINAFVSKAKKDHNVDPRENWSDTDLAELFVKYISANFVNIDSLPVTAILGEPAKATGEIKTDVQPAEAKPAQAQVSDTTVGPDGQLNKDIQPQPVQVQTKVEVPQAAPAQEPTAEIQTQA
jgi:hypothetical protein